MKRSNATEAAGFLAKLRTVTSSMRVLSGAVGMQKIWTRMTRGSGIVSRIIEFGRYHCRWAPGGLSSTRVPNWNP